MGAWRSVSESKANQGAFGGLGLTEVLLLLLPLQILPQPPLMRCCLHAFDVFGLATAEKVVHAFHAIEV